MYPRFWCAHTAWRLKTACVPYVVVSAQDTQQVIIKGVTLEGYLVATDVASGARVELEPDGNTFDMMRGLIQRKL